MDLLPFLQVRPFSQLPSNRRGNSQERFRLNIRKNFFHQKGWKVLEHNAQGNHNPGMVWKCPRLGAPLDSGRCPCMCQKVGTRWALRSQPKPFQNSVLVSKILGLPSLPFFCQYMMEWAGKDQGAEQDVMALTASCLGALHWESWGTVYFLFFQQKWIDVIGSSCLKSQHRMDSIKAPSNVTFPAPRINCWPTSWTRAAALIIYDPCWVEYPQAVLKSSFSSCTLWSVALIATEGLDF